MNFEDQIRENLKKLNRKQLCQFSWLCGLRALPFLSAKRGFAYWPERNRQKHLYSIFYALDVSGRATFVDDIVYAKIADAIATRTRFTINIYDLIDANAYTQANSAAANADDDDAAYAANAAANAVYAIVNNAFTVTKATTRATALDLESLLLKDIEAIKENKLYECNHDTSVYGKIWNNFQEDLKDIGCAYWARFYECLFNNGFETDKKQLECHLSIPDEIMAEGAAAAGRYLEGLGKKQC
jgi:hypothetical protein